MDTLSDLVNDMEKLKGLAPEELERQMRVGTMRAKLLGQQNAVINAQVQILEHQKQIQRYQDTLVSLVNEIANTQSALDEALKGGE